jgi:hypothetical protein
MYSIVHIGKYQSDMFPIQNGLKQGDALSPFLSNFALDMPLGGSKRTRKGIHQRLAYIDDVNIVGEEIDTIKKNTEALLYHSKRLV